MIMEATGVTVFSPSTANVPTSWPKPPAAAAPRAVSTSAAITGVLVNVTSTRSVPMVEKPTSASVFMG